MLCKNFNKCFNNKSFVLHSGKRSIQNPIKHLKSCFGKIFNNITSITRSFHIFMLWQSGWQITTFCHKIYIFGFNLLEAILKWGWLLASESRIYRFYDKKSSYLPSTWSKNQYVKASGFTCCYQALCPNRYIENI